MIKKYLKQYIKRGKRKKEGGLTGMKIFSVLTFYDFNPECKIWV